MATKVKGLRNLERKLRAMPPTVNTALSEAIAENATELTAMMRRLAPQDDGDLVRSIEWFWSQPGRRGGLFGRGRTTDTRVSIKGAERLSATIAAGDSVAYYAAFVEFGTQSGVRGQQLANPGANRRSRRSLRTHPGSRAQPFFFPSYRALRRRMKARMSRKMNAAIKRLAQT